MANHDAANLVYPLAKSLKKNDIDPETRRKIYRDVIAALQSEDYHDYPDLFKLDVVLQEVIAEFQKHNWSEYGTIDVSKIKPARRKGWNSYIFSDDPDYA